MSTRANVMLAILAVVAAGTATLTGSPSSQSDLDQFMERVLTRRDESWKRLQQYILDEREQFELRGPLNTPLWGQRREYTWFIRDGFFIRSPRTADGVTISEDERRKYEDEFLVRAKARERVVVEGEKIPIAKPAEAAADEPPAADVGAFLSQNRRPQFIDTAYFLRFRFEAGKYALVGRETVENRETLRIEYYPTQLFTGRRGGRGGEERGGDGRGRNAPDGRQQTTSRLFNKVAIVTLWVDPKTHQILRYTFDNLHLDYLPVAWFVRLDHLRATMTMSQPFAEVWLPRDIEMNFGATTASGSLTAQYRIEYYDYREATTGSRLKSVTVP